MSLSVEHLKKRFPTGGLEDLSLTVGAGEIFVLIGPSGCGKTTALGIIAGLITPEAGRVHMDGVDVTDLPPEARRVGYVFQHFALFPHMTVGGNVAYGLRARRMPGDQVAAAVAAALEAVGLPHAEDRDVRRLSGGEQQRVALARALAIKPAALLLDEPLSSLDAALRRETRGRLRAIAKAAATPVIHVTHDQEEALAVADRVGVMERGRIVQAGTPAEVWRTPATALVARLLGQANVLAATVEQPCAGGFWCHAPGLGRVAARAAHQPAMGSAAALIIRPDDVTIAPVGSDAGAARARIHTRTFAGADTELLLDIDGQPLPLRTRVGSDHPAARLQPGDFVGLSLATLVTSLCPAESTTP